MPRPPLSRRRFTAGLALAGLGAGAAVLSSRRARAAEFELRQFHNQPVDSPLHKRLVDLWKAVAADTEGRVEVRVVAENDHIPGGDPAALQMLLAGELDFLTLMGGLIGEIVPSAQAQEIPFAFRNGAQVYAAMDGDLGAYLHEEMQAKGLYAVPRGCFENGFRHITCATKPIRTIDDLQGLRIRVPNSSIFMDLFQSLGAAPVAINVNNLYESLKSGAAEAQENPLVVAEVFKLYEVQKYMSLTSHMWSGFNQIANSTLWQRLPDDVQELITRNTARFALIQRADQAELNSELRKRLREQSMVFNRADTEGFRARLGPFYARWKEIIGPRAWSLLEGHVGMLG